MPKIVSGGCSPLPYASDPDILFRNWPEHKLECAMMGLILDALEREKEKNPEAYYHDGELPAWKRLHQPGAVDARRGEAADEQPSLEPSPSEAQ
jgi:hypothetical protein